MSQDQEPKSAAQSQTASDYIESQLQLEEEAREALPYQFDACTKALGSLRQIIFACLTCTPPPASASQQHTPAGICYSCSISCHGEHNLVELFAKRDFICDCGTTRFANSATPCTLRLNSSTGRKGGVLNEEAHAGNTYNHNYEGKFCGCGDEYDPEKEKGTMFQCLGLASAKEGGCGEDWWHPECLMGIPRKLAQQAVIDGDKPSVDSIPAAAQLHDESEHALPPGFPDEDDFDHFICYKCVESCPWIKPYAGSTGFLPALVLSSSTTALYDAGGVRQTEKKRKAEDDVDDDQKLKKTKAVDNDQKQDHELPKHSEEMLPAATTTDTSAKIKGSSALHETLPPASSARISLFVKEDFREHLCKCPTCFPRLAKHPQLLEEEVTYEPPLSESDEQDDQHSLAGRSVNSGSLLERGEAALSSMDRVRAIEGIMAYNHVRDKVKAFLQPFAASGQVVSAEDIRAYFAQLRGDEQAQSS